MQPTSAPNARPQVHKPIASSSKTSQQTPTEDAAIERPLARPTDAAAGDEDEEMLDPTAGLEHDDGEHGNADDADDEEAEEELREVTTF